jgi:sarcosine oxidase subunit beta
MLLRFKRFERDSLKSSYDAVIIGGGLHGLASAYFLASRHGITDVASSEKFIGCGAAGRNTAIVRANQRTQENVPLYKEALDLWPILTRELDYNLMFNNCGNLNLMHSESAMNAARMNVCTAQFHGIDSRLVDAKECKELVPALDVSEAAALPPIFEACSTLRAASCAMMPWSGAWPRAAPSWGCTFTREPR